MTSRFSEKFKQKDYPFLLRAWTRKHYDRRGCTRPRMPGHHDGVSLAAHEATRADGSQHGYVPDGVLRHLLPEFGDIHASKWQAPPSGPALRRPHGHRDDRRHRRADLRRTLQPEPHACVLALRRPQGPRPPVAWSGDCIRHAARPPSTRHRAHSQSPSIPMYILIILTAALCAQMVAYGLDGYAGGLPVYESTHDWVRCALAEGISAFFTSLLVMCATRSRPPPRQAHPPPQCSAPPPNKSETLRDVRPRKGGATTRRATAGTRHSSPTRRSAYGAPYSSALPSTST